MYVYYNYGKVCIACVYGIKSRYLSEVALYPPAEVANREGLGS